MFILWLQSDTLKPSKYTVYSQECSFMNFHYYSFVGSVDHHKFLPHRGEQISLQFHRSNEPALKMLN